MSPRVRHRRTLDQRTPPPSDPEKYMMLRSTAALRARLAAGPGEASQRIRAAQVDHDDEELERLLADAARRGWTVWPPTEGAA
jgi:lipocalin